MLVVQQAGSSLAAADSASALLKSVLPTMLTSAALVDCGSGHTGIHFYSVRDGALTQHARASLRHADGGNLPITDCLTTTNNSGEFIEQLDALLSLQHDADGFTPDILYVGATGGVRSSLDKGTITEAQLEAFRTALASAFDGRMRVVKFEVLTGAQEAAWELDAAQAIWGGKASSMFPEDRMVRKGAVVPTRAFDSSDNISRAPTMHANLADLDGAMPSMGSIGLFSGGGQSMQLARAGSAPLSFPFSTFPPSMEERQGAPADAWLDDAIWNHFADGLRATIAQEATRHARFDGCFVGTAMNHRAALFTEIAETPITAAAAVTALRASLCEFRRRDGLLYERMMATKMGGPTYPLARITAMHTYRLATVLELMFEPHAKLFFARNGADANGEQIDCEWTVGAFVAEACAIAQTPTI